MRKVRSMVMSHGWLMLAPFLLAACGGGEMPAPEPEMESEPAAPDPAPASPGPRVVFMSPEDGGTYPADTPVSFQFGLENYELGAVPEEVVTARDGVGHHHLGVNTDCLAAGETIPQGDESWVHFGSGNTTIDMQLEPGEHSFVLQLGDDLHVTQAADGLCASVSITVE